MGTAQHRVGGVSDRSTAGYSGTPQARKLGLKPGLSVSLDAAPEGWRLTDPPPGLDWVPAPDPADLIVSFFRARAELPARLPGLAERIHPAGALWVAWPRRAGGHASDITEHDVRGTALPLGIVDVKVAAIDQDWSGLRFVWRTDRRSADPVRRRA
jgi:hypothetical protein